MEPDVILYLYDQRNLFELNFSGSCTVVLRSSAHRFSKFLPPFLSLSASFDL